MFNGKNFISSVVGAVFWLCQFTLLIRKSCPPQSLFPRIWWTKKMYERHDVCVKELKRVIQIGKYIKRIDENERKRKRGEAE